MIRPNGSRASYLVNLPLISGGSEGESVDNSVTVYDSADESVCESVDEAVDESIAESEKCING